MKQMFLLAAVFIVGFASRAESQSGRLPDLVVDRGRVQSSVVFQVKNFTRNDCALLEGSVLATGKRALMRFDVSAANLGAADLFLGDPTQHPDLFTYSPCHRHYHFNGYASYELLNTSLAMVLTGRKQAFCLEDFEIASATAGPAKYTCGNQGISVGWADTYGSYLDGQWLDITGIPPGPYFLRVIINPYNVTLSGGGTIAPANVPAASALQESNYSNNTAVVPVTIPIRIK